jgi:para-aminobenzoate synthetase component 1
VVEITDHQLIIHSTEDPLKIFEAILATATGYEDLEIPAFLQQRLSKDEYINTVELLKNHILNGDVYEVNFCQEFYSENFIADPPCLFNRLNRINPAPFACFLKHENLYALSASPERFLQKKGNTIISQPIKGTIARSNDQDDGGLIEKLRNDPKERAENVMIVDLVRNDLAKSAVPGSVKVEELFGIYSFPTVHQMISTVSATIRNDLHFTDVIRNAFPAGSITGAPKVMARQLIERYEKTKRGLFSGSIGFITPSGDFDFNIVIRSLLYNTNTNYLSFQTGSAITYDCIPEREYEECLLKAAALIETVTVKEKNDKREAAYISSL